MNKIEVDFVREPKTAVQAALFLDSLLGTGAHSPNVFIQRSTNLLSGSVVAAKEFREIFGVAACSVLEPKDVVSYEKFGWVDLAEHIRNGTVGLLESIAVQPSYPFYFGLCSDIAKLTFDFLTELECSIVIAVASNQVLRSILVSLEFEDRGYSDNTWLMSRDIS